MIIQGQAQEIVIQGQEEFHYTYVENVFCPTALIK